MERPPHGDKTRPFDHFQETYEKGRAAVGAKLKVHLGTSSVREELSLERSRSCAAS